MPKIPKFSPEIANLLGLKEKDFVVYTTLLKLGTAPLRSVAQEAGLSRGTTYDALKSLLQAGLISYVNAKSHRYFTCEDPQKLRGLVVRREVAIQEAREKVEEFIPSLQELLGWSKHRPVVRYLEGESGVRDILEDVLKETKKTKTKTYRVYSSAAIRDLIASAWTGFLQTRIRRGIHVRAISIGSGGKTAGLDERRWLSRESASPTYIFIYADKTAYVSVDEKKRLFGVMIEDEGIAETQKRIFDAMWGFLGS
ncbi:MAG: Transcriptional regulator, TrmB [Candidatus Uhrbacteria bacterium GW2011_GWE2_40_58]|nr:MAG: Transcriptional regulator, TrmB [Candidatus Uhrbacteria bacterium GW2011_GWF2_40_263]KKR67966.1 MAG: Transcriptional regulator, TrmB [Candidatus Uhrbacteria bacterium GW2011_GWE2_40_58]OGL92412.1 MAG: hypothetical protein A2239_02190 [Candidatus Uhrbacteria bacterium RIFOXYA2_FULL_40_9]OGL97003.1 MAG: hypothetical protein A2332_03995 [Candidatus Uhrbacteria bacterium RIFOXYB2_FULL_41_18]HBK34759.1 hypothetical protein [Candidatus Uhrbacteria bacterium]